MFNGNDKKNNNMYNKIKEIIEYENEERNDIFN